MAKETAKKTAKKAAAPAKEKEPKKNPLLDADTEDTDLDTEEEETDEETSDEEDSEDDSDEADEEADEDDAEEAPAKASKKAKPAAKPEVKENVADALKSDIARTKAIIEAEPKVTFMIPLSEGEKKGAVHECFVNGYKYVVKKGVMTEVPRSIAQMLADHYQITSEAGAAYRLDRDEDKQDALA